MSQDRASFKRQQGVTEENKEFKKTNCSANRFGKRIGKPWQAITPTLLSHLTSDAVAFVIAGHSCSRSAPFPILTTPVHSRSPLEVNWHTHTHAVRLRQSFYLPWIKKENFWALAHLSHHTFQTPIKSHDQGPASHSPAKQSTECLSTHKLPNRPGPAFTAKSMRQSYSSLCESIAANFGIFFLRSFLSPGLASLLT